MFRIFGEVNDRQAIAFCCYLCDEPVDGSARVVWMSVPGNRRTDAYILCPSASCSASAELMAPEDSWRHLTISDALSLAARSAPYAEDLKEIR